MTEQQRRQFESLSQAAARTGLSTRTLRRRISADGEPHLDRLEEFGPSAPPARASADWSAVFAEVRAEAPPLAVIVGHFQLSRFPQFQKSLILDPQPPSSVSCSPMCRFH